MTSARVHIVSGEMRESRGGRGEDVENRLDRRAVPDGGGVWRRTTTAAALAPAPAPRGPTRGGGVAADMMQVAEVKHLPSRGGSPLGGNRSGRESTREHGQRRVHAGGELFEERRRSDGRDTLGLQVGARQVVAARYNTHTRTRRWLHNLIILWGVTPMDSLGARLPPPLSLSPGFASPSRAEMVPPRSPNLWPALDPQASEAPFSRASVAGPGCKKRLPGNSPSRRGRALHRPLRGPRPRPRRARTRPATRERPERGPSLLLLLLLLHARCRLRVRARRLRMPVLKWRHSSQPRAVISEVTWR